MAEIQLEDVTKRYPDGTEAVKGINLTIADGELMILVGPSGCGKTTALQMLAGLEEISAGTIRIGGRVVNDLGPKERNIGMVFQSYALYPHMTVRQNMGFALRLAKVDKGEIDKRVCEVAEMLDLTKHLDREPRHLSGGQRQRVAMGRAIVREDATAFLMDEPLSNLDAKRRVQTRIEVARLQQRLKTTTVFVTHDQSEAMTLGHRVAVMRDGRIEQVDTPMHLYENPVNVFVAAFIGLPPMNLLPARLIGERIELPFGQLELPCELRARLDPAAASGDVIAGIRPEAFSEAGGSGKHEQELRLRPRVDVVQSMGSEVYAYFDVEARSGLPAELLDPVERDEDLATVLARDNARTVVARLPASTSARAGQELNLAIDTAGLRLFDAANGRSLLRPAPDHGSSNGIASDSVCGIAHGAGGPAIGLGGATG